MRTAERVERDVHRGSDPFGQFIITRQIITVDAGRDVVGDAKIRVELADTKSAVTDPVSKEQFLEVKSIILEEIAQRRKEMRAELEAPMFSYLGPDGWVEASDDEKEQWEKDIRSRHPNAFRD